jgi:hypothetical protein
LIDKKYDSVIDFSIEFLRTKYNLPDGSININTQFDQRQATGESLNDQMFDAAQNGQLPFDIFKGLQFPYTIRILSHF